MRVARCVMRDPQVVASVALFFWVAHSTDKPLTAVLRYVARIALVQSVDPEIEFRRPEIEFRRPRIEFRRPEIEFRRLEIEFRHP